MEERKEIITLVDEDGARLEFLVLDYFDVEEIDYAILMPFDQGRTDGESELLLKWMPKASWMRTDIPRKK